METRLIKAGKGSISSVRTLECNSTDALQQVRADEQLTVAWKV